MFLHALTTIAALACHASITTILSRQPASSLHTVFIGAIPFLALFFSFNIPIFLIQKKRIKTLGAQDKFQLCGRVENIIFWTLMILIGFSGLRLFSGFFMDSLPIFLDGRWMGMANSQGPEFRPVQAIFVLLSTLSSFSLGCFSIFLLIKGFKRCHNLFKPIAIFFLVYLFCGLLLGFFWVVFLVSVMPPPKTIPPMPPHNNWVNGAMLGCVFALLYWRIIKAKGKIQEKGPFTSQLCNSSNDEIKEPD